MWCSSTNQLKPVLPQPAGTLPAGGLWTETCLGFQPASLPCRRWKCQASRITVVNSFKKMSLSLPIYCVLSCVQLFASLRTSARQASLSMGFSQQEYWRGLPRSSPGDLPNPGTEPASPELQADSLPLSHWWRPYMYIIYKPTGYKIYNIYNYIVC